MFINKVVKEKLIRLGGKAKLEPISANVKNKNFNFLILNMGYLLEDFDKVITSKIFNFKNYKSIFHPRLIEIEGTKKKMRFDQKKYYDQMLTKYPDVLKNARVKVPNYRGMNLIMDLRYQLLFLNRLPFKGERKLKLFKTHFESILNDPELDPYAVRYILIPLNFTEDEYKKISDKTMKMGFVSRNITTKEKRNSLEKFTYRDYLRPKMLMTRHTLPVNFIYNYFLYYQEVLKTEPKFSHNTYFIFYNEDFRLFYAFDGSAIPEQKELFLRLNQLIKFSTRQVSRITDQKITTVLDKDDAKLAKFKNKLLAPVRALSKKIDDLDSVEEDEPEIIERNYEGDIDIRDYLTPPKPVNIIPKKQYVRPPVVNTIPSKVTSSITKSVTSKATSPAITDKIKKLFPKAKLDSEEEIKGILTAPAQNRITPVKHEPKEELKVQPVKKEPIKKEPEEIKVQPSKPVLPDEVEDIETPDIEEDDGLNIDELIKEISINNTERYQNTFTEVETKLIEKNKKQQDELQVDIGDNKKEKLTKVLDSSNKLTIEDDELPIQTEHIHEEFGKSTLVNFDKSYLKNLMKSDIYKAFAAFSDDRENPLFIESITNADSSDDFDLKETWEVTYRNKNNKIFKIKLDIPKVVDNRFLYLNGGKKTMVRQLVTLPITKNKQDEVFVATNYNKFQIVKKGQKLDNKTDQFTKALLDNIDEFKKKKVTIERGNNLVLNSQFINTADYNYYSQYLNKIKFPTGLIINFSVKTARRLPFEFRLTKDLDKDFFIIGHDAKTETVLLINRHDRLVYSNKIVKGLFESSDIKVKSTEFISSKLELADFLILKLNEYMDFGSKVLAATRSKQYTFSTVAILRRKISLLMLLSFYEGFFNILDRYGVEYRIEKKGKRLPPEQHLFETLVPFKDSTLIYKSDLKSNMLLYALNELPTREINLKEFDNDATYLDYFENTYNSRNVSKGFKLILDRMIDPITKEILQDMGYPTDITGVLLEANTMLADVKYIRKNNMANYRIRSWETIAIIVYRALAAEFNIYKTHGRFTIHQGKVLKDVLTENIVNEYSVLNVANELMEYSSTSWKGPGGINSDNAYTADIRSYDESMKGIFGAFSPVNANVGTNRSLAYNPKLKNLRGFMEVYDDKKEYDATNYFSPFELVMPLNSVHADPMRTAMAVRQTAHIIPASDTDAPMIGTGMEKVAPHLLSRDFVHLARQDGKVSEIDEKLDLMILKYKDGTEDVINLGRNISKNSQGGFYINNNLTTDLKLGESFKKGSILARNDDYFKGEKDDVLLSIGTLAKVSMACLDGTMEDGSFITQGLGERLVTYVTMKEDLILTPETIIHKMVKVGDKVSIGDSLAVFESTFDDEGGINLLGQISDEYNEQIEEFANTAKRSHYEGEIIDIKVYYNRDLQDFHPTLRKIINDYIKSIESKKKKIKHLNLSEPSNIFLPPTSKYEGYQKNKIKSVDVDGVLIEFFIRHPDHMRSGDKIAFQGACKTIVSETIETGEEPYSEFRPEENIDAIFSPLSFVSRMTVDIPIAMLAQKALVELKRTVKDIYDGKK